MSDRSGTQGPPNGQPPIVIDTIDTIDAAEDRNGPHRRSRRRQLLGALVGVVVAAVVGLALVVGPPDAPSATIGGRRAAAAFELPNLRAGGPSVTLASARGKPLVLNFWASWCVPCRREMPAFQAVSNEVGDRVAFIGVNHQDGRSAALDLLAETGVGYTTGYDPVGRVATAYGLRGMPTTVFISASGTLIEQHTGELSRRQLEATIERLFPPG